MSENLTDEQLIAQLENQEDDFSNIYIDDDMMKSKIAKYYRENQLFDKRTHTRKLQINSEKRVGNYITMSNQLHEVFTEHCKFTLTQLKLILYLWRNSIGYQYPSYKFISLNVIAENLHTDRINISRSLSKLVQMNILKRYEYKGRTYYQVNIFYDTYDPVIFHNDVDVDELVNDEIRQLDKTMKRWSSE